MARMMGFSGFGGAKHAPKKEKRVKSPSPPPVSAAAPDVVDADALFDAHSSSDGEAEEAQEEEEEQEEELQAAATPLDGHTALDMRLVGSGDEPATPTMTAVCLDTPGLRMIAGGRDGVLRVFDFANGPVPRHTGASAARTAPRAPHPPSLSPIAARILIRAGRVS